MLYGIIYLFKLSDFLAVARKHGASWICLSSCWLKENDTGRSVADLADGQSSPGLYQWTDIHELGFMGAFGMAYKMQIDGAVHVGKVADNHALARRAKVVLTEVHSKWREQQQGPRRELLVVPGTLIRTEVEVVEHARVPLQLFMDDTIPEKVPVYDLTSDKPERS